LCINTPSGENFPSRLFENPLFCYVPAIFIDVFPKNKIDLMSFLDFCQESGKMLRDENSEELSKAWKPGGMERTRKCKPLEKSSF
jgi:hypothetical protein